MDFKHGKKDPNFARTTLSFIVNAVSQYFVHMKTRIFGARYLQR